MITSGNLFASAGAKGVDERADRLLDAGDVRIERIVSQGHASAEGFWYDQPQAEWVTLLSGEAILRFEGETPRILRPGDWLLIPAHARHRVDWTSDTQPTIWLAVH